jgi:beta-glucosidase
MTLKFPKDFLFGTATASLQIEGGDTNNTWFEWSEAGHIKDKTHSLRACDHWQRIDSDFALHQTLNVQTYRLGLEWSRLEPKEGEFSAQALENYRYELKGLNNRGIVPLVTLYHFSLPLWFSQRGGWVNPQSALRFWRYVDYVARNLSDLVQDWITINEPNIYLTMGYLRGEWPPGKKNAVSEMFEAARNLVRAHVLAYDVIHHHRPDARVGVAHHLRVFDPLGGPLSHLSAYLHERIFQTMFLESMTKGRFILPLGRGYPYGKRQLSDFIGINYYTRDMVRGKLGVEPLHGILEVNKKSDTNELGWEIYPRGLSRLIEKMWKRYRLPIWITENGICDSTDQKRTKYLINHLSEIHRCLQKKIPVERYYHWTLLDNFEWIEGESARFGFFHNDFETQTRTLRPSGKVFAQIALTKELNLSDG